MFGLNNYSLCVFNGQSILYRKAIDLLINLKGTPHKTIKTTFRQITQKFHTYIDINKNALN